MPRAARFLFVALALLSGTSALAQATGWVPVVVDSTVATRAAEHISAIPELEAHSDELYLNVVDAAFYVNDSLRTLLAEERTVPLPFRSYYQWLGDTLLVYGVVGMFEGSGFTARVYKGQALVRHFIATEDPIVGYTPTDTLRAQLEVPCTQAALTLSTIPAPGYTGPLFGHVEFRSMPFYMHRFAQDDTPLPREAGRADLRAYFRGMPVPRR